MISEYVSIISRAVVQPFKHYSLGSPSYVVHGANLESARGHKDLIN